MKKLVVVFLLIPVIGFSQSKLGQAKKKLSSESSSSSSSRKDKSHNGSSSSSSSTNSSSSKTMFKVNVILDWKKMTKKV